MYSTERQHRRLVGPVASRVLQTWVMAFVILISGVTQSGFIPALLGGFGGGVSGVQAAVAAPGGNVLLICTADGIQTVLLDETGDATVSGTGSNDRPGHPVGHVFCALCATHHGAVIGIDLPYAAPVAVIHDVTFAAAIGFANGHDIPRSRHSRAPPVSV